MSQRAIPPSQRSKVGPMELEEVAKMIWLNNPKRESMMNGMPSEWQSRFPGVWCCDSYSEKNFSIAITGSDFAL